MRIDIDRLGTQLAKLDASEKRALNRAKDICDALGKHCDSNDARNASSHLAEVIHDFCPEPATNGKPVAAG